MENLHLIRSFLAGILCGFVVSVPVGPVNLTVINQALRRGFSAGLLMGLGAICADAVYASLALWGHSSILMTPRIFGIPRHSIVLGVRIGAVVAIAALGIRYLLFRAERLDASEAAAQRLDERWHHPRSFFLGFALTITNFMLVVVWATLITVLFAHEWVTPRLASRVLCIAGVLLGGAIWFCLVAFFVSRAQRRVTGQTLTMLVRGCGALFLGFAGLLVFKLFQ
ncbi:MAG TPA: LysE family transporter [Verrucomicrobiae bacterium]|nr:LysE family transporter [Verrucomicrobiae bacterium]